MTFADVMAWCKAHQAEVRGISRGKAVSISCGDQALPLELPPISAIFHWDVKTPELSHYVSGSDFERIVTGKLTIEDFKSTLRGNE